MSVVAYCINFAKIYNLLLKQGAVKVRLSLHSSQVAHQAGA